MGAMGPRWVNDVRNEDEDAPGSLRHSSEALGERFETRDSDAACRGSMAAGPLMQVRSVEEARAGGRN